jgi:hypothetical protein
MGETRECGNKKEKYKRSGEEYGKKIRINLYLQKDGEK